MEYDDLDEELLVVAGRSRPGTFKRQRSQQDGSDDDYDFEPRKKSHTNSSSLSNKQRSRDEKANEDLEDEADSIDGYGSDLMGDEEDRARLAKMSEMDREMELFDRAERREKAVQRRETAQALKKQKREQQQQQRSASKASVMRSSTRQKGIDSAKKNAMAELVAAKNARAQKESTADEKRRRKKDANDLESEESEYELSDRSAEHDSAAGGDEDSLDIGRDERKDDISDYEEDEEERGVSRRLQVEEESEDAEFRNLKEIQVRRYMLEKWQNEPFFEGCLPGAVIRVAVGGNRYFMAQIIDVEKRPPGKYKDPGLFRIESPYEFPEKGAKTSKWLYVQRGASPRVLPMTLVSNHGISEDEFWGWRQQCEKDNRSQITIGEVDEVKARLKNAATYVYTAEDVAHMVEEKRERGEVHNLALEKSRLSVRLAKAREDNQVEEIERLEARIVELEAAAQQRAQRAAEKGVREGEERGVKTPGKTLAEVNKLNALRNMENALKNVGSRPEGSSALISGFDPFSRRQTRPMNYWSTKRVPAAGVVAAGLEEGSAIEGHQGEAAEAEAEAQVAATATENKAGGIDLNIELSELQQDPRQALLIRRLLGPNWAAKLPPRSSFSGRKTLTLADYKRRQGIA